MPTRKPTTALEIKLALFGPGQPPKQGFQETDQGKLVYVSVSWPHLENREPTPAGRVDPLLVNPKLCHNPAQVFLAKPTLSHKVEGVSGQQDTHTSYTKHYTKCKE